jgi:hypothetical protein
MRVWSLATAVAILCVGTASVSAATACGSATFTRFGETRANFRDVLAACRPDGYCSALVGIADRTGQTAFLQQLRVARPSPNALYRIELAATTPMPSDAPTPMSLQLEGERLDISNSQAPTSPGANEYRISDSALTTLLVDRFKHGGRVDWTYASNRKLATASFSLNGMMAALDWIDCMESHRH